MRKATVATYKEFVTKSMTFHMSWTYSRNPMSHSCFTSLQIKPVQNIAMKLSKSAVD